MTEKPFVFLWSPDRSGCGPLLTSMAVSEELSHDSRALAADVRFIHRAPTLPTAGIDEIARSERRFSIVHPVYESSCLRPAHLRPLFGTHLLSALNDGRGRVFLDFSNEGIFLPEAHELSSFLEAAGVTRKESVTVVCQNRSTKLDKLSFSHLPFDYFLVMTCRSVADQRKAGRLGAVEPIRVDEDLSVRARILCLNATPRSTRIASLLALIHHGAIDLGSYSPSSFPKLPWVSFPGLDYGKAGARFEDMLQYLQAHGLSSLEPHLPSLLTMAPLTIDRFAESGNGLFDKIDLEPYRRTTLSCVTETTMVPDLERITEKTLKPALFGHPFVVFGPRGAVQLVREFGFRTFAECIDHSYDTLEDEGERIMGAAQSAARFVAGVTSGAITAADLHADSRRNVEWGSGGFPESYRDRYLVPLVDGILHRT